MWLWRELYGVAGMYQPEWVSLTRDCDAILIPVGTSICIPQGSQVFITQALGGSFTVNVNGNLARIAAKDADALGKSVPVETAPVVDADDIEDQVWEILRTCYDPEIPVNIVELGLVYECKVTALDDKRTKVDVQMTLTAPGCGMGPTIVSEVEQKLQEIPSVQEVNVELVFDPPWDRARMSDAARLQLGVMW